MTDPTSDPAPTRFHGSFTTSDGYVQDLVRTFVAYTYSRPRGFLTLVLAIVIGGLAGYEISTTRSHEPAGVNINTVVVTVVVIALALGAGILLSVRRLRRQFTATIPLNSTYTIWLRDSDLRLRGPLSESTVAYRAYESVETRGDFVLLKNRGSRVRVLLPAQLFTPESLAYLREKVGQPVNA
jgi:hypothetical protein